MPLKWRIFRVIHFIFFTSVVALLLFRLWFVQREYWDTESMTFFFIFISAMIVLLIECICNQYWLFKHYPANYPSSLFVRFSLIIDSLCIIILLFILSLFFYLWFSLYSVVWPIQQPSRIYVTMTLFGITSVCGIYVSIAKIWLIRSIREKFNQRFNDFIEDID